MDPTDQDPQNWCKQYILYLEEGLTLPKGFGGRLAGLRTTSNGSFHQIKVRQPVGRKISIQTVLPRIRG
jgi:hypothetical protein